MKRSPWVFVFFILCGASHLEAKPRCENLTAPNLLYAVQNSFETALKSDHPGIRIEKVREGLKWAGTCVKEFPAETGCLYYRALLQGLSIEQTLLGAQKGLQKMLNDLDAVILADPRFDEGGAYRVKGFIFLKAPQFSLKKKGVTQDLELARDMAQKALQIAPRNRENRLLMASVLAEEGQWEDALKLLKPLQAEYSALKAPHRQEQKDFKDIQSLVARALKENKSKH